MTTQVEVDRRVSQWLREGPTQLPDDVLHDVLGQVVSIPQRRRRWWGSWRLPAGNVLRLASASAVALVLLGILVVNGSRPSSVGPGPSASPSPAPSAQLTPSPTAAPGQTPAPSSTTQLEPSATAKARPTEPGGARAALETVGVTYPQALIVGDRLVVEATLRNRGDLASAPIELRFWGLVDYATLLRCTPACTTTVVYGEIRTVFGSGVNPGETTTFRAEFQATKAGDFDWTTTVGDVSGQPFLANCHTSISAGRTLTPTIAPPPVNDNPPGVAITSLPFTDTTNVARAEIHAMEPTTICGGGSKSVWYSYTATDASTLVADTIGSDYDTVLDIWRGSLTTNYLEPGFETLQPLACSDDAGSPQSAVVFATQAGQSYVIRVTSKDGTGGNLKFHLAQG